MATIFTTKGDIEESLLVKTDGFIDDAVEYTTWQEWRLDGELVKREAQIQLKLQVESSGETAEFA